MTWKSGLAAVVLTCLGAGVRAEAAPNPSSTAALADGLRAALLDLTPDPLVEDDAHWGGQRLVADGIRWHGRGIHVRPEIVKAPKNDGLWWKLRAGAERLPATLAVDVRDVAPSGPGVTTLTASVAFDARVDYDQQNWERGVRLYAGNAEARMRVRLTLRCEATTRLEPNGTPLPDAVFRLRVTDARLGYDHFEVVHVAGVGGDLAKVVGEAAKAAVERWHPSLERDLLRRADAAIIKAGDTKEVRVSVRRLLGAE